MSQYATATDLRAVLPEATSDEDSTLTNILLRVSEAIDTRLGRTFSLASGTPTARIYTGANLHRLAIDFYQGTITSVTAPAGYSVPDYRAVRDTSAEYAYLVTTNGAGVQSTILRPFGCWEYGVEYTVSADWGYSAYPPDIVQAALSWATTIYQSTYVAVTAPAHTATARIPEITQDILRDRLKGVPFW